MKLTKIAIFATAVMTFSGVTFASEDNTPMTSLTTFDQLKVQSLSPQEMQEIKGTFDNTWIFGGSGFG